MGLLGGNLGGEIFFTPSVPTLDYSKHLGRQTTNPALRTVSDRNMQQRWQTYLRQFKRTLRASHT
jgi:hypothetical protein